MQPVWRSAVLSAYVEGRVDLIRYPYFLYSSGTDFFTMACSCQLARRCPCRTLLDDTDQVHHSHRHT